MFKQIMIGTFFTVASFGISASDYKFSAALLAGVTSQKTDGAKDDSVTLGFRGAYLLHETIALEASYFDYGKATANDRTISSSTETTAYNFGLKGGVPLENNFSIVGRLGLSKWDTSTIVRVSDTTLPSQVFTGDDSGNDFYYGIGIEHRPNPRTGMSIEYTRSEYDVSLDGSLSGTKGDLKLGTILSSIFISF